MARAAAVKLLLTLQLSLKPHWACKQMFQSHLWITAETAFLIQCLATLKEVGRMLSSCISWAERANLFRRTQVRHYCLKQCFHVPFQCLFVCSMFSFWKCMHVRSPIYRPFVRRVDVWHFQERVTSQRANSVWTVCQKEITGQKTWSPVSLYAFPLKLRMQVGLIFPCCNSSVFTCTRVLLNKSAERKKYVFTEDGVERSKIILLIVWSYLGAGDWESVCLVRCT